MIPVAMPNLNRPEYLNKTLTSMENAGFFKQCDPKLFALFDGGSDQATLDLVEQWRSKYGFLVYDSEAFSDHLRDKFTHEHGLERPVNYFLQFQRMQKWCETSGYKEFMFAESDVVVSKNFYEYVNKLLGSIGHWDAVSFYAIDEGNVGKLTSNLYLKNKNFTGTCMLALKCEALERATQLALVDRVPLDIAIGRALGVNHAVKDGKCLYIHIPSLAQHFGATSVIGAPYHTARRFYGEGNDCMRLV